MHMCIGTYIRVSNMTKTLRCAMILDPSIYIIWPSNPASYFSPRTQLLALAVSAVRDAAEVCNRPARLNKVRRRTIDACSRSHHQAIHSRTRQKSVRPYWQRLVDPSLSNSRLSTTKQEACAKAATEGLVYLYI